MRRLALLGRAIPFALMTALVIYIPYAKVEESFNIQASHDLIYLSATGSHYNMTASRVETPRLLSQFDHHLFPGVVPRTFVGSFILAGLASPIVALVEAIFMSLDTALHAQILVRWALGMLFCGSLDILGQSLARCCGELSGVLFSTLVGTQFHLMFYASRTLPNTFACILVFIACALALDRRWRPSFALLAATAVIFRADVLVFTAPLALLALISGQISLPQGVLAGLGGAVCGLLLSVPLDSYYWQYFVWPEAAVFWFNTGLNKSSDWGVSPPLWYFYSVLPRVFGTTIVFFPVAAVAAPRELRIPLLAAFGFLGLYSVLPHKELRFVLMSFPILFLPLAAWFGKQERWSRWRYRLAFSGCVFGNLLLLLALTTISADNYPGAAALDLVHRLGSNSGEAPTNVYIDAFAGMTGVSRFLKRRPHRGRAWVYCKDPDLFNRTADVYTLPGTRGPNSDFDYLIVRHEDKEWHLVKGAYRWVEDVASFDRVDFRRMRVEKAKFLSVFARR